MYSQILVLHSNRFCQDTIFGVLYISLQSNMGKWRNEEIKRGLKANDSHEHPFYNPNES